MATLIIALVPANESDRRLINDGTELMKWQPGCASDTSLIWWVEDWGGGAISHIDLCNLLTHTHTHYASSAKSGALMR